MRFLHIELIYLTHAIPSLSLSLSLCLSLFLPICGAARECRGGAWAGQEGLVVVREGFKKRGRLELDEDLLLRSVAGSTK